jgi:hypothetical protein
MAAVLVVSFGLKYQGLSQQDPLPSIEEDSGDGLVALALKPATDLLEANPLNRSKVRGGPRPGIRSPVVIEGGVSNGPARSESPPAPRIRFPAVKAPQRPAPRIVVGSDDVWGLKSYRERNFGDALAYDSDSDATLERLFGEN